MKSRKYLLYSLLAHGLALGLLLIHARTSTPPQMPNVRVSGKQSFEVSLHDPTTGPTKKDQRSSKPKQKTPSLKDLGLGPTLGPTAPSAGLGGNASESDGFSQADSIGMDKEGDLYPFFEALWRRINSVIGYPDDFVQERIHGNVTVQIPLSRQGVFQGTWMKVNSESPLLKTYVVASMVQALKEPLAKNLWADRDRMILVAEFDFQTFGPGQSPRQNDQRHMKNMLYFLRDAYVDPKVNQVIQKILTKYMPPIIPIPGGFYIDFIQAYRMIEAIGKPDPDDMRQIRIQMAKENWDEFLKKSPSL